MTVNNHSLDVNNACKPSIAHRRQQGRLKFLSPYRRQRGAAGDRPASAGSGNLAQRLLEDLGQLAALDEVLIVDHDARH